MTVENIKFTDPTLGTTSDNAGIVVGGETQSGSSVLQVADLSQQQLAIETLLTLKKIEYHLMLMTDADLEHTNL